MKRRARVAWACFRRFIWLLRPDRPFLGWRGETGWNSGGQIGLVAAVRTFGISLLDVKVFYDERNQHLGREEGCH